MLINLIGNWSQEKGEELKQKFLDDLGAPKSMDRAWFDPRFDQIPNVKMITENDFWWHRSSYSHKLEAHCMNRSRKVTVNGVEDWRDMFLYYSDIMSHRNGGHGVLWCYNRKETHYFKWSACDHKWESRSPRMCYHIVTCKHCKAEYDYHSD